MRKDLQRILELFTPPERRELALVFALMLAMAFLEVAGVASIMPFLSVLASPDSIGTSRFLSTVYEAGGFDDPNSFLFALGVGVFLIIIVTNSVGFASVWSIQRFTWMRNHSLSTRLLSSYVRQPWAFFLQKNTSELAGNVLAETQSFITSFLLPLLLLIANGLAAIAVGLLLVAMDPVLAILVAVVIGGMYGLIFFASRSRLRRYSSVRKESNKARYKFANEAMAAIKTVKIAGVEESVVGAYSSWSQRFSASQSASAIIGFAPRYGLETLAFGSVIVILLYQLMLRGDVSQVIPVVGMYAFAGYRLIPKLQLIFFAASQMQYTGYTLDVIHEDSVGRAVNAERCSPDRLVSFESAFGLSEVTFSYENATAPALMTLSLRILKNSSVGIVGTTGSGKTTCVDVLLGLHKPTAGGLVVDDKLLDDEERVAWRRHVGYVPQDIFLSDDTIAANIAFGVNPKSRSREKVERAARIANLDSFVRNELSEGYDTIVGERGVRLSGGQRQRIGIARALYEDPDILVFDEATSALDNTTERSIMEAIESLSGQKTLIMIAHRLTTVRDCDVIFRLERGRLAASGTWDELMREDEVFREMLREAPAERVGHQHAETP